MPDFRVADTAAFDDKMIAAGNSAVGLWVRAGAWCMQQLTDGFVPTRIARQIGSKNAATRLTDVGLWEPVEGGYQFNKFLNHQRSKEQVETEKAAARQRMKRVRSGERAPEPKKSVRPNSSPERSPHVRDSLPFPSHSGYLGEEGDSSARAKSDTPPPATCPQHPDGTTAPCRGCADARRDRERWDAQQALEAIEARRREREDQAAATAAEIVACDLCDERGYVGTRVCDHDPTAAERNRRGAAMARAALAKGRDS